MPSSRLQTVMATLKTNLAGWTVANGYNLTIANITLGIRPLETIKLFPEIGIEPTITEVIPRDDKRSAFDELTAVSISLAVSSYTEAVLDPASVDNLYTATENAAWDMRKFIATNWLTNNITGTPAWNVELSKNKFQLKRYAVHFSRHIVSCIDTEIIVRIRALDASFDD